ncbi:MAG TPA: hypothetical protein VLL77_07780 [Anaerolineales bacterium]|nr:hypothetical protein [Anaerolineales bacterium]
MASTPQEPRAQLQQILESARRLGVEMDEAEALQWLGAMAAGTGGDIVVDSRTGVFGHKVSMLDFSPADLERFREMGRLVEILDEPGVVETALALSGSAAQSKIQTYPGDCDFFERVNLRASTREEACLILARVMRDKAIASEKGPAHQLIEVKFGNFPEDLVRNGVPVKAGAPISWTPAEIRNGRILAFRPDGTAAEVRWEAAALDPGWCKFDWVVADAERGALANASNMLDVTWEAPDGTITPLDGYLDPYFQEVYLEAESIPIFSKLARHVSADALEDYVTQLEREVQKYVTKDINYGKAAKRMYNIFRLTGRYEEAAYIRELFDEPATVLYQVWTLIRTIDDAALPDSGIPTKAMVEQTDRLILEVIKALEDDREAEIVKELLRLRDGLTETGDAQSQPVEAARDHIINLVNNFFHERLTAVPTIQAYLEQQQA